LCRRAGFRRILLRGDTDFSQTEHLDRWAEKHRQEKRRVLRMEFRTFVNHFIKIPCQIVQTGRRIVYRLLSWRPCLPIFRRLAVELNC
jgi:hypothetical protein